MNLFVREDGVAFAINTNRAKYPSSLKKSQFDRNVNEDASLYGSFVLLSKNENNTTTVTFSREPGFSAADYIKSALPANKSINSIYVEELKGKGGESNFICIVICDGEIVADFDLSEPDSKDDLRSILASKDDEFTIFCAVDDALIQRRNNAKQNTIFIVDDNKTGDQITVLPFLKQALAKDLAEFEFKDLTTLIKAKAKKNSKPEIAEKARKADYKNLLYLATIALGGWFCFTTFYEPVEETVEEVDPFATYRSSIAGLKSPVAITNSAIKLIYATSIIQGWKTESAVIENGILTVRLENSGGDITSLMPLKSEFGDFVTGVDGKTMVVTGTADLRPRRFPDVTYIFDEVDYLLYEEAVIRSGFELSTVGEIDNGSYYQRQYKLDMSMVGINELQRFGVFLRDKPVVINKVEISPDLVGNNVSMSVTLFGVKR